MAVDLSKLGGASAPGGSSPVANPGTQPGAVSLPDFGAPIQLNPYEGESPFDTLGRQLWGTAEQRQGLPSSNPLNLPVIGDAARWIGENFNVGVGAAKDAAAQVLGSIPNGGITDQPNKQISYVDQYSGKPIDAVKMLQNLNAENANLPAQFMVLGHWQQLHDPEALKDWEQVRQDASKMDAGHAGSTIAEYIRKWGTTYADLTPNGVQGMYDVAPELAFAHGGSWGQSFSDDLQHLMLPQRYAEKGLASIKGVVAATIAGTPENVGRIRDLRALASRGEATPIELAALQGLDELGWSPAHAYNFLLAHGQGYSADGPTQLALAVGLDPLTYAGIGATLPENIAGRVGLYANTAESASRMVRLYQGTAARIGTTVTAVRASELGPAFKVMRTLVDPLSAIGSGPHAVAQRDVLGAAGLEATKRAFGSGAFLSARRLAQRMGIVEGFDNAFAVSAANFARKWVAISHIDNALAFGHVSPRMVIPEDVIEASARNAPKDAVTRMSTYVTKHKQFYLSTAGRAQLAERIAKMAGKPISEVSKAVARMSDDERGLWHALTYSDTWGKFVDAKAKIAAADWGKLAGKQDDLALLNPSQIDMPTAESLLADLQKAKPEERATMWNAAADQYSAIEDIGRVEPGMSKQMEARLRSLDRMISEGQFHGALSADEVKALPKQFVREFVDTQLDSTGKPLWRIGFKPKAQQASGLVYDQVGQDLQLVARFEPNIDNVAHATPGLTPVRRPLTDALGRVLPDSVMGSRAAQAAARTRDGLDVLLSTASDVVDGERLMLSMEQSFVRQMREAGYSTRLSRNVFKVSREYARENTVNLAGLSPDNFWDASKEYLAGIVDEKVAKRDIFAMMSRAAGGDMRLIGLTSGTTQRIRSGLIARGLDPNNYLGAVTVQLYNKIRYELNPMFFLQAVSDAPFFGMYRGNHVVGGGVIEPGSDLFRAAQLNRALGHSGTARDLAMDYVERHAMIGWQEHVIEDIGNIPGVEAGFIERAHNWTGRLILKNELEHINANLGQVVMDALSTTRKELEARAAAAATPEEAALWRREMDQMPMFEYLREQASKRLGRVATDNEVGLDYLSEMAEDSRLEIRTPEGLLNYKLLHAKGTYHMPTDVGEVQDLNLDYLAQAIAWPNVHTASDLKAAIGPTGDHTVAELREAARQLDLHPDHINRAVNSLTFVGWRPYFDGLRQELGMSTLEMQGIEEMVVEAAKAQGVPPVDYLTQVMSMTGRAPVQPATARGVYTTVTDEARGVAAARQHAADYMAQTGRQVPERRFYSLDEAYSKATSKAYEKLPSHPVEPLPEGTPATTLADMDAADTVLKDAPGVDEATRAAYQAFVEETKAQYDYLRQQGVEFIPTTTDPYKNSAEMMADVAQGRLRVYSAPANHPLLTDAQNTMFRAVHDYMAHASEGFQFGPRGELNAAIKHSQMYSPEARKAMLTETHGQNSYVNFSTKKVPGTGKTVAQINKAKPGSIYAEQKAALLPPEVLRGFEDRFIGSVDQMSGVSEDLRFALDVMRAAKKGQAGVDEMAQLVAGHLHPSMKQRLLDAFIDRIGGKNGLIEQAQAAGDAKLMAELNRVLEDLKGGWGMQADREFRDMVIRRAGGEVTSAGEQMPQPWRDKAVNPYADKTELVPVSILKQYREIDREVTPRFRGDFAHLDELTADIRVNGFREPVVLDYDPVTGKVLLGEGNHRLAVAERLGLDTIPVRVHRANLATDAKAVELPYEPRLLPNEDGYFPADASPSQIGLPTGSGLGDPEVERAARYFSKFLNDISPNIAAGEQLKFIADNIPTEGYSASHFTQKVMQNAIAEGYRLAEKDAIRLAHMDTERSVLNRTLNHPLFALYPTSYFWGKVIPETIRFIGYKPFGVSTGVMALNYYKVQETIALQSEYDPELQKLWKDLGKSAVLGLFSYISPGMPWEELSARLPPWVSRGLAGEDLWKMTQAEMDTFSPERWVKRFADAAGEVTDLGAELVDASGVSPEQQRQLDQLQQQAPPPAGGAVSLPDFGEPTPGTGLAPVLGNEMDRLQQVLSGR